MTHRYVMAIAVFVTILAAGAVQCSGIPSTYALCIEYIGQSDKPVARVFISDSGSGIQLCRKDDAEGTVFPASEHVVSANKMKRMIELADGTSTDRKEQSREFGILAVVIIEPDHNKRVLTMNRAHSMAFLKELRSSCGDHTLRSALTHLRDRMAV